MSDTDLPEHVRLNRAHWDRLSASYAGPGRRAWASDDPRWGIWGIPERDLQVASKFDSDKTKRLACRASGMASRYHSMHGFQ